MKSNLDLNTPFGFYETFFNLLPFYETKRLAFDYLNNEVEFITGERPYKNYKSFRKSIFFK